MSEIYTLVERESNYPDYIYKEQFDDVVSARQRLHELYVDNTQNVGAIEKAEIFERSAVIYFTDGNELSWDIE